MSTTPVSATLTTPAASAAATDTPARHARVNRRPHPNLAALKERAFALTCTGLRSPAIALQLGVPERTIRRWVNDTLLTLAQDALEPDCACTSDTSDTSAKPNDPNTLTDPDHAGAPDNAPDPAASVGNTVSDTSASDTRATPIPLERHRALAIERQLALAVTAHAAYDRLMARHDDLLDVLATTLRAHLTTAATADGASAPASLPPSAALLIRLIGQLEAGATRHLRIVQTAHREAARFQGVPAYAQTDARLTATQAHADATAEPDEDAEPEGVHYVPIEWVDPNDPTKVGLVPHSTFDAKAAIDDLCNGPTSSLDRLKQADETANIDDDEGDEQSEEAILVAILAEQAAGNSSAVTSVTTPATAPATLPATGAATAPATSAATTSTTIPIYDTEREHEPWQSYEQRQRLREEVVPFIQSLASTRPPPTLPRSNTVAALFLRNPHYVF